MATQDKAGSPRSIALVLAGGNALGAYTAGAYETLQAQHFEPDVISGCSIGAVMGAIIAGNPPATRVARLREFWAQAALGSSPWVPAGNPSRRLFNRAHAIQTFLMGRPGLFVPRLPGALAALPGTPNDIAIFDHRPSIPLLERVIDFELLNRALVPLIVNTVDMRSGEAVRFDNRRDRIEPRHLLASTGLAPAFPPIEIDGRLLGDAGLIANLPIDPVLAGPIERDLLCIAVDLFAPNREVVYGLDAVIERSQDILFAAQTRRALEAYMREHRLRHAIATLAERAHAAPRTLAREGSAAALTVVYVSYHAPPHEVAAKTLEFSRASVDERWRAGMDDMERALARLRGSDHDASSAGCTFYDTRSTSNATL